MREIKFRAWDGERMISLSRAIQYGLVFVLQNNIDKCNTLEIYDEDICLMQYTGLKDKNGNEIYEGDILHHNVYGTLEVIFDDGSFKLKDDFYSCNDGIIKQKRIKYFEIIGNIYENLELLKGE